MSTNHAVKNSPPAARYSELHRRYRVVVLFSTLVGLWISMANHPASAERPSAPEILPADTVAFVSITDTPQLREDFRETSLGRILQDPELEPLFTELYDQAATAYSEIEAQVGAPLEELLQLPQGEICAALVLPKQGRPALVLMIDVGNRLPVAQALLQRMDKLFVERGRPRSEETFAGTTLTSYKFSGRRERSLIQFERDDTIVFVSNEDVAKQMLVAWDEGEIDSLANKADFNTLASRFSGADDIEPQIKVYTDPIRLAQRGLAGNLQAQAILALFPAMGLDGIRAAGGSITLSTDEYDGVSQFHILLDNPRSGILEMLALKAGDTKPEPWIPSDVAGYTTLNWDFQKTFSALGPLYDSIRGEGALERDFTVPASENLGVDFQEDILSELEGRVTHAVWMVKPARLNSPSHIVAFKAKDPADAAKTLATILKKHGPSAGFRKDAFAGVNYWHVPVPERRRSVRPNIRRPEPCITLLGDYLIMTDSVEFLKHAIVTNSGGFPRLGNQMEYRLITSRIKRQPGGEQAGMISFERPEEGMRQLYDLATSETTRQQLSNNAERNRFVRALDGALSENPLPPFSVIAKYLAPGGSLVTSDDTGIHYISFTLRRK